jgi:hypothetical protein
LENETDEEEEELSTPTTTELVAAVHRVGIAVDKLFQAEAELQECDEENGEVSQLSPDSLGVHCPQACKIIRAIIKKKHLCIIQNPGMVHCQERGSHHQRH